MKVHQENMKPIQYVLLTSALLSLHPHVTAQTIKSGLWEIATVASSSPEEEKILAEKRRQFSTMPTRQLFDEAAAKKDIAVSHDASSMRVCITKEMAEHATVMSADGDCQQTDIKKSGNVVQFSLVCEGLGKIAEGKNIVISDNEILSSITYRLPDTPSRTQNMKGIFLASDCGKSKPSVTK